MAHGKLIDTAETEKLRSLERQQKAVAAQKTNGLLRKAFAPEEGKRSKGKARARGIVCVETMSSESILFADLGKIRKLATAFQEQRAQWQLRYFQLQSC